MIVVFDRPLQYTFNEKIPKKTLNACYLVLEISILKRQSLPTQPNLAASAQYLGMKWMPLYVA